MRGLSISKAYMIKPCRLLIFFVGLLLILQSCSHNQISSILPSKDEPVKLHRIAVFPIQRIDSEENAEHSLRCPICGTMLTAGRIESPAEKTVEDAFLQAIGKTGKFEIVPPDRVFGIYQSVSADSLKTPLKELLIKSGRELGADAVVYGYVYRYRERKGYSYGADQSASVAFAMHLLSVRDGSVIWKGVFDKTQRSLMENIFHLSTFFKEGGKWVTAQELTEEGIAEILKTFPGGQ